MDRKYLAVHFLSIFAYGCWSTSGTNELAPKNNIFILSKLLSTWSFVIDLNKKLMTIAKQRKYGVTHIFFSLLFAFWLTCDMYLIRVSKVDFVKVFHNSIAKSNSGLDCKMNEKSITKQHSIMKQYRRMPLNIGCCNIFVVSPIFPMMPFKLSGIPCICIVRSRFDRIIHH